MNQANELSYTRPAFLACLLGVVTIGVALGPWAATIELRACAGNLALRLWRGLYVISFNEVMDSGIPWLAAALETAKAYQSWIPQIYCYHSSGGQVATFLLVPSWLIAIFPLVGSLIALRKVRNKRQLKRRSGHCQRCGYDLTGNLSGVCPECGVRKAAEREKGSSLIDGNLRQEP